MIALKALDDGARMALTFAHPKGNILTEAMIAQWRGVLIELEMAARHVKLLTIEGVGPDFSFGANVVEHAPGEIQRTLPDMDAFIIDLLRLPMPTAALVRGRCLGGGFEVALACDFILADEGATFGLPELQLGAFAPIASVLLPARVGAARATSALLTGRSRSAREWHQDGLVELVSAPGRLEGETAHWFAATLGRWSAEALRHAVLAARADVLALAQRRLPETERLYLRSLAGTRDAAEGVAAFLSKRRPNWLDQ